MHQAGRYETVQFVLVPNAVLLIYASSAYYMQHLNL